MKYLLINQDTNEGTYLQELPAEILTNTRVFVSEDEGETYTEIQLTNDGN
jgi:hypothetical protein